MWRHEDDRKTESEWKIVKDRWRRRGKKKKGNKKARRRNKEDHK